VTAYQIVVYIFAALFMFGLYIFVFLPTPEREEAVEKTRLAYLYERKDVIYDNLRDLNFEYKSGKFSPADFEAMRNSMEAEAAGVLAEIERLEGSGDPRQAGTGRA
jgi:hypothetical protein